MATEKRLIDAIETICSLDAELEAISKLLFLHEQKHHRLEKKLADREKTLRWINKWNAQKIHDEAIEVMADVDNYDDEEEDYD